MNIVCLGENKHFNINLSDEVVRGSIVLEKGKLLWPPPAPSVPVSAPATAPPKAVAVKTEAEVLANPCMSTFKDTLLLTSGKTLGQIDMLTLQLSYEIRCFCVSNQSLLLSP